MCGICGYFSSKALINDEVLTSMNDQLKHRGPDDFNILNLQDGSFFCGLGHRRLSIVDLVTGAQPMSNEDNTIWIVYNGEIYNHGKLRKILKAKGHIYRTQSDTETIVHLYEDVGERCVEFLRGMFAFAIYDKRKGSLFLARDRLGIKPLYYATTDAGLVFASEIKAILKSGLIEPQINYEAISEYFAFGYVTNDRSMFKDIKKLLPGHYAIVSNKGFEEKKYWNIEYSFETKIKSFVEYKELLFANLEESVKLRLMSDVPLGVFLSGGIDSSAIAVLMSRFMNEPLKAFTIGFEKPYYSESMYAEEVAKTIGAELYQVILSPSDFIDSIEKLIWHEDKPLTWPSGVALYLIANKAREEVKVVLTGEGSDELFGGYDKYWVTRWHLEFGKIIDSFIPNFIREKIIKKYTWKLPIPLKLKKMISHSLLYHKMDIEELHFDNFYSIFPQYQQETLFSEKVKEKLDGWFTYSGSKKHYEESLAPNTLERLLYTDIKTYLVGLLMKQDKMSMAASIESRVPYLDHKLVEFAGNIPRKYKIRGINVKHIVKETMKGLLPKSVVSRSKMGFPTPIGQWLKEPKFNNFAKEILFDNRTKRRGFFNIATVENLVASHVKNERDNSNQLWSLINFELWNRIYFD